METVVLFILPEGGDKVFLAGVLVYGRRVSDAKEAMGQCINNSTFLFCCEAAAVQNPSFLPVNIENRVTLRIASRFIPLIYLRAHAYGHNIFLVIIVNNFWVVKTMAHNSVIRVETVDARHVEVRTFSG